LRLLTFGTFCFGKFSHKGRLWANELTEDIYWGEFSGNTTKEV